MKKSRKLFISHLSKYKKEYTLIAIFVAIGFILGVIYIQKGSESELTSINSYIQTLISNIKNAEGINKALLLLESLKNNCIFIILICFLGCTIIGSFFIYLACLYKGFSLGYTVAAIFASSGIKTGIIFVLSTMILQNIILFMAIFLIANSGIQSYVNIKRNIVNLKVELFRHSLIMLISLVLSVIASFIEVYISTNFLIFLKDFL